MVYLDYSATTPVDRRVLEQYVKDNDLYYGNPNSTHKLGKVAKKEIDKASKEILEVFGLKLFTLIYTSGASESNNLAIKGLALAKQNQGKHLITSNFEHSSVISCLSYLSKLGFLVDVVPNDDCGLIDLEALDKMITEETILVTIGAVNSETGILQDIEAISKVINKHANVTFHSDMTQAVGKIKTDYSFVDMISFSSHKFYGLKGIGGLLVKEGISLVPQIHGGKSTTSLRSGTPATPLILSVKEALKLIYEDFDRKQFVIKEVHDYLLKRVKELDNVVINSNDYSINQIVNISFLDILSGFLHDELSKREIYISTSTACASEKPVSMIVEKLTGSYERAETSVRISLSHLTTKRDIDALIDAYKEIIKI